jgi:hypothetical protein
MPKQGWAGLGELLRDLYRELTPVVRICLFAGMTIGFALGLYIAYRVPGDESWNLFTLRLEIRLLFLLLCGLTFLGAILGTAFGVTLELVFGAKDGPAKKIRRRTDERFPRRRG